MLSNPRQLELLEYLEHVQQLERKLKHVRAIAPVFCGKRGRAFAAYQIAKLNAAAEQLEHDDQGDEQLERQTGSSGEPSARRKPAKSRVRGG